MKKKPKVVRKRKAMLGSVNFAAPYNNGDRVVLIAGGTGQNTNPMANPFWGKDDEYVAGVVLSASGAGSVLVQWDNGISNVYDLRASQITLHIHAPTPAKKFFSAGNFDTTHLDKLVLEPDAKAEIVALLQQHKHSKKIFDEWGLGEVIEYGRGMTMMFHGKPGTGKTFGANCIAKALGKELLVISAAEIQSSEPGGANRAIQNAFSEAKSKKKVLFIDECDSLIANRNNLGMILSSEVNTLLTEIEKTEGVVILATNMIESMDPALERRLQLIVKFPEPNFDQRKAIWTGLLPKKMPLAEDVKVEDLAENELTGGLIKNVVLQAARLAISDLAEEVAKKHFDKAISRVKSSQGLMGRGRVQLEDNQVAFNPSNRKILTKKQAIDATNND